MVYNRFKVSVIISTLGFSLAANLPEDNTVNVGDVTTPRIFTEEESAYYARIKKYFEDTKNYDEEEKAIECILKKLKEDNVYHVFDKKSRTDNATLAEQLKPHIPVLEGMCLDEYEAAAETALRKWRSFSGWASKTWNKAGEKVKGLFSRMGSEEDEDVTVPPFKYED